MHIKHQLLLLTLDAASYHSQLIKYEEKIGNCPKLQEILEQNSSWPTDKNLYQITYKYRKHKKHPVEAVVKCRKVIVYRHEISVSGSQNILEDKLAQQKWKKEFNRHDRIAKFRCKTRKNGSKKWKTRVPIKVECPGIGQWKEFTDGFKVLDSPSDLVEKVTCDQPFQVYNKLTNSCVIDCPTIDINSHFNEADFICLCNEGFIKSSSKSNSICIEKPDCQADKEKNQIYNENLQKCVQKCSENGYFDENLEKCVCENGYEMNSLNRCIDIDECSGSSASISPCKSSEICTNIEGSYLCESPTCPTSQIWDQTISDCRKDCTFYDKNTFFDSTDNSCHCKSGYLKYYPDEPCVYDCAKFDENSDYNFLAQDCYCLDGFIYNGVLDKCVVDCEETFKSENLIFDIETNSCICADENAEFDDKSGDCVCKKDFHSDTQDTQSDSKTLTCQAKIPDLTLSTTCAVLYDKNETTQNSPGCIIHKGKDNDIPNLAGQVDKSCQNTGIFDNNTSKVWVKNGCTLLSYMNNNFKGSLMISKGEEAIGDYRYGDGGYHSFVGGFFDNVLSSVQCRC